jgi:UDP-N-acetylmuramoyl-tripeptide--D-alanyl-D-alanine ligase
MINMPELDKLYSNFLASSGITTDTRNIKAGNIFFALKGEKFNANMFVKQAFEKGATYVVVDEIFEPRWEEKFLDRLILVDDVLRVLQQLAGVHRKYFKCPVLAITGSNGKTTTKELIATVLSKKFKTYATKGNLNNHIGIPITLLSVESDAEFVIIEMGANHLGEIASYCEYVQPDYGLITNVGFAHTEGFGGIEEVLTGKTELYRYIARHKGKIFVSADNEILLQKIADIGYLISNVDSVITYGKNSSAFCRGDLLPNKDFLSLIAEGDEIRTNLVGDYNFENVISAVGIGKYFRVDRADIKEAIESYIPTNNRSQKISYGTNTVILDAYNANPSSMLEVLKNFEKIDAPNKIVILGEMMELGNYAGKEHEKIKVQVENMQLEKKIFVGNGFQFLKNEKSLLWFERTSDLKEWFKQQKLENNYILIKGSRKNELEKILNE